MQRFILLFLLLFSIGYVLFYFVQVPFITAIHTFHQNVIMSIVSWVIPGQQLQGYDVWISDHYKIVITPLCDGVLPFLVFAAFVWAKPFDVVYKLRWTVIGYATILAVNAVRIVFVVAVINEYQNRSLFFYLHDVLGNIFLSVTVLYLAYRYVRGQANMVQ